MPNREDEKNPYKPFQPANVEPKFPRDRGFAVTHTLLRIKIDEKANTVEGTATLTVQPIHDLDRVELDAASMEIRSVTLGGKKVAFDHDEPRLVLRPAKKLAEAKPVEVKIDYFARPRRGLYFIQPDKHYPKKPYQVWSQGESEDNHNWFPGYDYPNNKATSEAYIQVRAPYVAFSNGHLVGVEKKSGWATYHWKQDAAQPNYLIAVVVGEFDEVKETWDGIPLHHFVPKGMKPWAVETFKQTANILAFFSRVTGYRYPYPKYAQAVIADFMWGGMENTSMTTVNERFLILPEHRDDADPDGLVAHEAAHQWFGDLITTKSWDHIWLNEGFATYFDALWHEGFHGKDLFQQELVDNADAYFAEDKEQYRRPIVTRTFAENEDLFDRHTYQKGSLVLHMLRTELGDGLWWKSIRHYVKKFEWKNVETSDLKIAIEEATGRSFDWFFDQWVYKAGHPEFEARWDYDDRAKFAKVTIKQTQKVVGETPLFRVPMKVWVWSSPKAHTEHEITITRTEESFFLPSPQKPVLVQLDPHGDVLKRLTFEKGTQEWAVQLEHAPDVAARIEACRALGKKASDPKATEALGNALRNDKFWGVRRAAAAALGEQATRIARDALATGIKDRHPRVRRGIGRSLGNFRHDEDAAQVLERMINAETKSDYVIAAALFGLAQTRTKRALPIIKRYLDKDSHNEILRTSVLAALPELRDEKVLDLALDRAKPGVHPYVRGAALNCLARMWDFVDKKRHDDIRDVFTNAIKDPSAPLRRAAYSACAEIPDAKIARRLALHLEGEPVGLLKKIARDSLRSMHERLGEQSRFGELRKQFEDLQGEHRKLLGRIAELEGRLKEPPKPKKTKKPRRTGA
jgi:aminopeptidase N